jgi:actin-related protein
LDPEDLIWDIMQGMITGTEKPVQPTVTTKRADANEISADAKMADGTYFAANSTIIADPAKANATTMMDEALDLDEMICQSICAVENADLRKRLASSIILVGGVSKTEKLVDWLEDSVFNKIRQSEFDETIECVEVMLVNLQQQQ